MVRFAVPLAVIAAANLTACSAQPDHAERPSRTTADIARVEPVRDSRRERSLAAVQDSSTSRPDVAVGRDAPPGMQAVTPDIAGSDRRPLRPALVPRWHRIDSFEDTMILHPQSIVATGDIVAVFDAGREALLGLDPATGAVRWRTGTRGNGPGEFQNAFLNPWTNNRLIAFDIGQRRLSEWSSQGELLGERSLPMVGTIHGVCRNGPDETLFAVSKAYESRHLGLVAVANGEDTVRRAHDLFPDRVVHRSGMDAQIAARLLPDHSCAVYALREAFLSIFTSADSMARLPLIESVSTPQVVETPLGDRQSRVRLAPGSPYGVRAVAMVRDRVFVAFGGTTKARRRLIDVYRRTPWQYEGSALMAGTVREIAGFDSTLVILSVDTSGFNRIDVLTVP